MINSRQRAYLRSLANNSPARYQIGKGEISENQIKMLSEGLEANEIIKINVIASFSLASIL